MMETAKLKGKVKITLVDELTGETIVKEFDNMVVDAGANIVRDFLANDGSLTSTTGITHLALGTGTTAPAATDTQLELEQARFAIPATGVTKDNRQVKFIVTIGATDYVGDVSEFGLFINGTDAANTGTLYARVTVTPFTKSDSQALTVEWTITM